MVATLELQHDSPILHAFFATTGDLLKQYNEAKVITNIDIYLNRTMLNSLPPLKDISRASAMHLQQLWPPLRKLSPL
jgi:hypothetical protein